MRHGMPFNLGWWGFTFPLGVYSLATLKLGDWLGLAFFQHMGLVLVVALAGLWMMVASLTLRGAWRGELFVSPCIAGLHK
ncbi:C4-dicarboxylate transporter/malic acid transport protein [compost metagenome]